MTLSPRIGDTRADGAGRGERDRYAAARWRGREAVRDPRLARLQDGDAAAGAQVDPLPPRRAADRVAPAADPPARLQRLAQAGADGRRAPDADERADGPLRNRPRRAD